MASMRSVFVVLLISACSFDHSVVPSAFSDAASSDAVIDAPAMMGDGAMATKDGAVDAQPTSTISCPGSQCGNVCCVGACAAGTCAGEVYRCDGPEDCDADEVCCNDQNGSSCSSNPCTGGGRFEACHTTADCSFTCNDCSYRSDYGQKVCCE
jgi:hypothetical protein